MADLGPNAVPDRIAIDAHGYGWRVWDDEDHWSMVPQNPDNSPIPQPVTWFVPAADDRQTQIRAVAAECSVVLYSGSSDCCVWCGNHGEADTDEFCPLASLLAPEPPPATIDSDEGDRSLACDLIAATLADDEPPGTNERVMARLILTVLARYGLSVGVTAPHLEVDEALSGETNRQAARVAGGCTVWCEACGGWGHSSPTETEALRERNQHERRAALAAPGVWDTDTSNHPEFHTEPPTEDAGSGGVW